MGQRTLEWPLGESRARKISERYVSSGVFQVRQLAGVDPVALVAIFQQGILARIIEPSAGPRVVAEGRVTRQPKFLPRRSPTEFPCSPWMNSTIVDALVSSRHSMINLTPASITATEMVA
jgi:hypothetical protein